MSRTSCARIEDLLTTTRLDLAAAGQGAPPLHTERVEPRDLVAQALERCAQQSEAPLQVEIEVAGEPPPIEVDPMLIRRVLENLLRNAAHHGGAGTPIVVRLVAEAQGVSFEVQDRGAGVAAEDLPRLFEPFFRADRSRARSPSPQSGGVGLGLTLCRRIVEAHGGTITARSAPGEGTTIAFRLPPRESG
jgi:signal transduction histidine kinase